MESNPKEDLLRTLQNLAEDDFKTFKWYLEQPEVLEGLPAIPKCRLEKVDRLDTVDLMVQTYSEHTLQVTRKVLRKMNKQYSHTISERKSCSNCYYQ